MDAQEGINDLAELGWAPLCSPIGRHRYEFHLYALDSILDLPVNSSKTDLRMKMEEAIVSDISMIGVYEKV